jgi:hypothetical protein
MTVIASDGSWMVADSRAVNGVGDLVYEPTKKIVGYGGFLFGHSGANVVIEAMAPYYLDVVMGSKSPPVWRPPWVSAGDSWSCLVIRRSDGARALWSEHGVFHGLKKQCAVGQGADFAIGAMECGATAVAAVRAACRLNIYCGPPLLVVKISGDSEPEWLYTADEE